MNTKTDTLKRDDMAAPSLADMFDPKMVAALKRAASRGAANLPQGIGNGWLMVGSVQVAYSGARAWRL